ncbi:MAG TPA: DUF4249 domain-containing protein [Puia sp.]|nr:DUF4249 domain-containing protein [Puia sp.]
MSATSKKYWLVLLAIGYLSDCRKPYNPPVITTPNNYLVVDGVINTGTETITSINVNRTRNLGDTVIGGIPELNAQVAIVTGNGATYPLTDTAGKGIYTSIPLTLDINQQYGITIKTSDGRKYASDLVTPKQTPPIDSLYIQQPYDLTFYVNTHDPAGNTRYYRWDYIETWEHDAQLQTGWTVVNHLIVPMDSTTQTFQCWSTVNSSTILLANTAILAQDIVNAFPIETIPNGDDRVNNKYSLLVREYALTADAYNYWLLIQKTSQKLGTLFDLQPSQLVGNIHPLSNPNEPVIGFMSASSIRQKRIFLYQTNLTNWQHNTNVYQCDTLGIPVDRTDYRIYTYPDTLFAPYYFISGGPLILATRRCVDCLLFGGTNIKPSYWK